MQSQPVILYHLGLSNEDPDEWRRKFGHLKVVCMGGTGSRMRALAQEYAGLTGQDCTRPTDKVDRYELYTVGRVAFCSHGIGMASLSVLLHELVKLLRHSGSSDFVFLRVGTCGGVGVEGGEIVVSDRIIDTLLRDKFQLNILGNPVLFDCKFDSRLIDRIRSVASANPEFRVTFGTTMSTNDFYEEQARLDGAACDFTDEERNQFLQRIHDQYGVRNIEMESGVLSAMSHRLNVKACCICVSLLNRLRGETVDLTTEQLEAFECRLSKFVLKLVADLIEKPLE